jgi:diguanylate cyclase (GGDEF)-like protein
MSGADVCRCLRADFRTASAGIIFVTGRDSMADIEAAFDAGADDYIIKPVHQRELLARAQALLRRGKELRGLSPVTGLPGNFVILTEISRLIDGRASFALIYADLDNFKSYNDRYGFLQGDHAILVTANCLRTALDGVETEPRFLGHVGGDDFVLLVGSDDAESVANAVTTGFDASAPLLYADEDLKRGQLETIGRSGTRMNTPLMTISMGISSTSRREFRAPHDAVAVATELKALAKESRGSCWRVDRRQTG